MIPILISIAILAFCWGVYWTHASPYSQFFGRFPYRAKSAEKQIALTFDDGPNGEFTSALLDILKTQSVPATFFVVGKAVAVHPDLAKQIVQDGHVIGNHSYDHVFLNYLKAPRFEEQIQSTQEIIKKTTDKKPALFRPPWLYRQPALFSTLKRLHLQPVSGVFCHPFEVGQISAERIARAAVRRARPGGILIFHDGHDGHDGNRQQTIEAVRLTIEQLKRQGYKFTTVDKLLAVPAYL